jgi:sulfate-transporting ATPase
MDTKFIYQMQGLKKTFADGTEVLKGIWLSFYFGAKIGVVGQNGSGKSTLLKIMAGLDQDFDGEVWRDPSIKVGYLEQEPQLDPKKTVKQNIEEGLSELRALLDEYEAVTAKFAEELSDEEMDKVMTRQGELQDKIDALDAWNIDRTIEIAMDALRVPPGDSDVTTLSGGERRRVALCRLLLAKPGLLLLDEPTNHLDAESVAWLERHLAEYAGTVIIVTHDRYFLDNVTKWILELENGKGIPYEGNYSGWLEQKKKRLEETEKAESARQKVLARELEWVRMGQRARVAKNLARLKRYDELLVESESADESRRTNIGIPPGPRLGELVVRFENVKKGFGDRLLIDNLSFDLPRAGIVGVIGPNGAGKTTLFKMITGAEGPDSGVVRVGETVKVAHVDQAREELDGAQSVWMNISGGNDRLKAGGKEINSRAYVSAFGFRGSKQQQAVGTLSGGERGRVHLAKLLQSGGNLILLDEPTNDLDTETLRELEDALEQFPGCAVVISHDRWFLDRVATHILAFEGNSEVVWYEGNYADYEQDKKKRLGADALVPKRLKYRPLTRA